MTSNEILEFITNYVRDHDEQISNLSRYITESRSVSTHTLFESLLYHKHRRGAFLDLKDRILAAEEWERREAQRKTT